MPKIVQAKRTFQESVIFAPHGVFFRMIPTTACVVRMYQALGSLPLRHDLHVTTLFSKDFVENGVMPDTSRDERTYSGSLIRLEHWPGHDDSGYLVGIIESGDLRVMNKELRDKTGLKPTFDEYRPHITLVNPIDMLSGMDAMDQFDYLQQHPLELEFYDAGFKANTEDV